MRLSTLALMLSGLACVAPATAQELIYTPLPPCRVLDTRAAPGGARLGPGATRTVLLRGVAANLASQGGSSTGCGVPDPVNNANVAQAVAVNIVAVSASGPGFLIAFATGSGTPAASTLNYDSNQTIANGVIVPVCLGSTAAGGPCQTGDLNIKAGVSPVHVVIDVVGYFHGDALRVGTVSNTHCNAAPGSGDICAGTDLVADGTVFAGSVRTGTPSNANCNNAGDVCSTTDLVADGDALVAGSVKTGTPSSANCNNNGDICATTDVVADINVRAGTFISAGSDITSGRNVISAGYGALKAAAYLRCRDNGSLIHSYDSEAGASAAYVDLGSTGKCAVDFGFNVDPNNGARHFVVATCVAFSSSQTCSVVMGFSGNRVELAVFSNGSLDDGREVMVVVF